MLKVRLSNGNYAKLDDEYIGLTNTSWYETHNGYAMQRYWDKDTKTYKHRRMHRVVIEAPKNMLVDHINGDKLDNRKSNLRLCTPAQNMYNRKVNKNNKTMVKGVHKTSTGYRVRIQKDRVKFSYGTYKTLKEAQLVAGKAYKILFKEFSC